MKKRIVSVLTAAALVMGLAAAASAEESMNTEISAAVTSEYTVTIPVSIDAGTLSPEDFKPGEWDSEEYGVAPDDIRPAAEINFDIRVDQFVEITTQKEVKLEDAAGGEAISAHIYPYERAFEGTGAKSGTVTLYQDEIHPGTFSGSTTFDIGLVTYKPDSGVKFGLGCWTFTWNNSGELQNYTTWEERLDYAKAAGYEAIGFNTELPSDQYAYTVENGMGMGEVQGTTDAAALAALDRELTEAGVDYETFKVSFPAEAVGGKEATAENVNADYAAYWNARVQRAVDFNIALNEAGGINGFCTVESEPMGNSPFQSAVETALFVADVARRTEAAGYTNYIKHCLDLGHTYSYLTMGLGGYTQAAALEYFAGDEWASSYFAEQSWTGGAVKAPETVEQYMELCKGQVKSIEFWDNNHSTFMDGGASGSHYGFGQGRIDYNAYMDALMNIADFDGEFWIAEFFSNETVDAGEIGRRVSEAPSMMREWELLYAVERL